MIAKAAQLTRLARTGYRLLGIEQRPDGGLRVELARNGESVTLAFEHFEVPALWQATDLRAFAS